MNASNEKLVIMGLGYVGLPLALQAHKKGKIVLGYDTDAARISSLQTSKNSQIEFSANAENLASASVIIICVPTPVDEHHNPDLGPVKNAAETIGKHLQEDQLVILESTVNPGVTENVVVPILEAQSGLKAGADFYVAHCPERINPGDSRWHVGNIPRVIGGYDEESLRRGQAFYSSIIDAEVRPMKSLREAEAVKIVENSFRDINIAFVNELAQSFSVLGIDVVNVIDGAATKPFAFMPHYPGIGVGGHCIPVDPYYLIEDAKRAGFSHDFLSLARRINNRMPSFAVRLLADALNDVALPLKGTPITILGLSYKPGVGDLRESPALVLRKLLEKKGSIIATYDPYVPDQSTAKDLQDAITGAKAIVIATAHPEYKELDFSQLEKSGVEVVVDGRNMFARNKPDTKRLKYVGVGVS
jgi:UDP-N-acetyl-D-glucosamine dehydrogenase